MKTLIRKNGLWVRHKELIRLVPFRDISHILHSNGLTEIHSGNELLKKTLIPLGGLERRVPETIFFRIHRNFIINRLHIRRCDPDSRFVIYADGKKFPVSRRRRKDFQRFINQTA